LTDADAEVQETLHWLDTPSVCEYLEKQELKQLTDIAESIGRQLGAIMRDAETFCK